MKIEYPINGICVNIYFTWSNLKENNQNKCGIMNKKMK